MRLVGVRGGPAKKTYSSQVKLQPLQQYNNNNNKVATTAQGSASPWLLHRLV
jgi:hypothetical protein